MPTKHNTSAELIIITIFIMIIVIINNNSNTSHTNISNNTTADNNNDNINNSNGNNNTNDKHKLTPSRTAWRGDTLRNSEVRGLQGLGFIVFGLGFRAYRLYRVQGL